MYFLLGKYTIRLTITLFYGNKLVSLYVVQIIWVCTRSIHLLNIHTLIIQSLAQNQDDPNVMWLMVIHFRKNILVSIIIFSFTSTFDLISNNLLMPVGLKYTCKLRLYHNSIQGDSFKGKHQTLVFLKSVYVFNFIFQDVILHNT